MFHGWVGCNREQLIRGGTSANKAMRHWSHRHTAAIFNGAQLGLIADVIVQSYRSYESRGFECTVFFISVLCCLRDGGGVSSHLSRSFGWLELCLAWGAYIEATTERREGTLS